MSNEESTRPQAQPDPLPIPADPAEIARIAQQLAVREQQQAAIASLGLRALEAPELQTFMDHAVREVQRTLGVDYVKLLELQPNGQMLLRAGVGWEEGVVGHTTIAWDSDAQAAYTLREQSPLIVEDLTEEHRFVAPGVLLDHKVRSGISCVIRDGDGSYGVLGTHSRSPRKFRREDTDFVVAAAAVITAAVNRHQTQLRMALESALARAQTEAANLTEAARLIHTELAEPLHVAVGELWEPHPDDSTRLRRTVLTMLDPSDRAQFEAVFASTDAWTRGQGTIGRAIERRHAEWISLRKAGEATPQAELMRGLGLESGLVIPVSVGEEAIAVLTVFSRRWMHVNSAFLHGLDSMGRALGEFARRREVESRAAWLAAITASAQDAVSSQDFHGTVTGWLEGAERLYGYESREMIGRAFDLVVPEDRREELRAAILQIRAGELVQPFETVRTRKDGTTIHVSVRLAPIRDPRGTIIGISATDRDVTEQRRANEALSASERRFRSTFENAAVGMAHVGLDGRFLRVNARLLDILRYDREALLQRRFQDITHAQHLAHDLAGVAALARGTREHYTTEKRYIRGDGSIVWANVTSAVVRNSRGEAEYFITVIEDIEDRRRAAAELRESEWRFRQMVVHSPVPLMVFDRDGRIVALSRSWTDLFGYRGEELPTVHTWVEKAYREDPTGSGESVELQWQLDDASEPTERDIWTASGERRTVLIQTMGLGDGDEDSRLRICAAADITTQKQAARELLEASRQKDEFLAMLSHELRNPLAAVRSATELIKSLRGDEPDLRRPLGVLERQTAHIAKLLDGLLDLSRVVRGSIVLEPALVDFRELLRDVVSDLEEPLLSRGIRLVEQGSDEPVWLFADPIRITQVIDNLLSNAIKYTEGAGTIVVDLRRDASLAVLTISDTGVGIDADLLPHVFDTFRQAKQTLDRSRGGLGLGLALVRTLVERHRGTVTAHSEGPGKGSQFVVTLPAVPAPQKQEPRPAPPAPERLPKVLIVEDNEDAAEMLDHALRMRGYETQLASHGQQALELARAEAFDVVLCDVGLPMGMSGFDVARRLRSGETTRDLKLVALTGYGTPEDRRKTQEAGFDAHLTKPVDFTLLTSTLERLTTPIR